MCVCWDGHAGEDCNYSLAESINLYVLLGLLIVASVMSFLFIARVKYKTSKKTQKSMERKHMIVDRDHKTVSWRTKPASPRSGFQTFSTIPEES